MGYMFVTGECLACRRLFAFNPYKVPSKGGEPICKECMEAVNKKREEMGMEPFRVPSDAYEPVECI